MSIPLLKIEIKSNYKITLLFLSIITLYAGIITAMYDPKLSAGINEMADSMPQLFAAFGMENPGVTLIDFLTNYLYGFILILIPFIYSIVLCYNLVAKYIDKGSMAYLLNTHYSRRKIIVTQLFVLLSGVCLLILYAAALISLCSALMFQGELDLLAFFVLNLGLLALESFLAALCFMFSCLFNEIRFSVGLGAGLGMVFFLIQMLSNVDDRTEFLKYFTPFTLFNPEKITAFDTDGLICAGILLLLAVLFFITGIFRFQKRDLPL